MRKFFIGIICLLLSLTGISQQFIARLNKDSLNKVLLHAKDTQRVNTLNFLARRYLYIGDQNPINLPETITDEAYKLAVKLKYDRGIGQALLNRAIKNLYLSDLKTGLDNLHQSRYLLRKESDLFGLAASYDFSGNINQQIGNYKESILYLDSAQTLYKKLGDTTTAIWNLTAKGNTYFLMGDFLNAYKIEQEAYDLTPSNDTTLKTVTLYYMTQLFLGAGLPEMALEKVHKIISNYPTYTKGSISSDWSVIGALVLGGEAYLQLSQVDSAVKTASMIKVNLEERSPFSHLFFGRLFIALKQYDSALVRLQRADELTKGSGQPILISEVKCQLAKAHLGARNITMAINQANQAFNVARSVNALLELRNASEVLSQIYDYTKEYTKAYYFSKRQKAFNDSLMPEQDKRKLSLFQVENELVRQRQLSDLLAKEAVNKEQQLKKAALIRNILIVALALFLFSGFMVIRNILLKRKNEKLQLQNKIKLQEFESETTKARLQQHAVELEMKALRAQMNPHFIFNCLNAINHFILKNETETASDFLTRFSRLIRMVLQTSAQKYITLEEELGILKLYIGLEQVRFKDHFDYTIMIDQSLDIDLVRIPPMLLQPFIENAIWHGLMHRKEKGLLKINIKEEDDFLYCYIEDNGIGRKHAADLKSKSASLKKSMGMKITENRLQMLSGSQNGFTYMKVTDLENKEGKALGTLVEVKIPIKNIKEVETSIEVL